MALDFTPITTGASGKVVKEESFTPEFVAEFTEAWEFLKDGTAAGLKVEFPDAKQRDQWFDLAVAYGKREGVSVYRVKGSDSMNKEHGRLSFKMVSVKARQEKIAKDAAQAQRAQILKSYGYELTAGSKTPEQIQKEDAILTAHYQKTPEEQAKHLEAYVRKVSGVGTKPAAPAAAPAPGFSAPKPGAVHGHGGKEVKDSK